MNIQILPTDKLFTDSPDAGTKECICSRCLKLITEEEAPAIRVWPEDESTGVLTNTEYIFHINCLSENNGTGNRVSE